MHFPYEILLKTGTYNVLKRVVALNAISEYGHIRHRVCVPSFSQESVPAKMTTNVAAEEVPESKAATPVKQQIIWRNVVLLTVIHLLGLYAAFVVPRSTMIGFIWRKWRLAFTPTQASKNSSSGPKKRHRM